LEDECMLGDLDETITEGDNEEIKDIDFMTYSIKSSSSTVYL